MTNDNDLKLFRGDYGNSDEKPHTWFRKLERQFDENTPIVRKHFKFARNLEPGHTAEIWYEARTAAELADWIVFYAAFTARWPKPTVTVPSRDHLLSTLMNMRLDEASVGCTVGPADEQMLSHLAWAEQVKNIVNAIGDDGGLLITPVRDALPLPIRLALVSSGPTAKTWTAFLTQVTSITYASLKNQLDLLARSTPNPYVAQSPMTALTSQFTNQSLSPFTPTQQSMYSNSIPYQTPPPYQAPTTPVAPTPYTPNTRARDMPPHMGSWGGTNQTTTQQTPQTARYVTPGARQAQSEQNPFLNTPSTVRPNQNSLFYKVPQTPQTPQTPSPNPRPQSNLDVHELAKRAVATSATYTNDAPGVAQYEAALAAWNAMHPNVQDASFMTTVYPLRPGTAQIGSRECFRCGLVGHIATAATGGCPNLTNQLDRREQNWRMFISRTLYSRARLDTVRIAQITTNDDAPVHYSAAIYDTDALHFEDETADQGNGQEMGT